MSLRYQNEITAYLAEKPECRSYSLAIKPDYSRAVKKMEVRVEQAVIQGPPGKNCLETLEAVEPVDKSL